MELDRKVYRFKKIEYVFNWISIGVNALYLIWFIFALIDAIGKLDTSENFHTAVSIYLAIIFIFVSIGVIILDYLSIRRLVREKANPVRLIVAIYLVFVTRMFFETAWVFDKEDVVTKDIIIFVLCCILMVYSIVNVFICIKYKVLMARKKRGDHLQ